MYRSTREHPMNSFQRILLNELSKSRHTHDLSILDTLDDLIHTVESGTNAMQVAVTLAGEMGERFWSDYYYDHREEVNDGLMKLFLSRWSGLDLLMEELFANLQSHNLLIQEVPWDLSFRYYQTVLPEVGELIETTTTILSQIRDTAQEPDNLEVLRGSFNSLSEGLSLQTLNAFKGDMEMTSQTLERLMKELRRKPGQLFILRYDVSDSWPRMVAFTSTLLCSDDTLYILAQLDSLGDIAELQEVCFKNSLCITKTLKIRDTIYFIAKRFLWNNSSLSRIIALRFSMAVELDCSLAESDAYNLMKEPAVHRERMMRFDEDIDQPLSANSEDKPIYTNWDERINSLKVIIEDANGPFDTLSSQSEVIGDPQQTIVRLLAEIPESYGLVRVNLETLDSEHFFILCSIFIGQLCGILSVWPPKLWHWNEIAIYLGGLIRLSYVANDQEEGEEEQEEEEVGEEWEGADEENEEE